MKKYILITTLFLLLPFAYGVSEWPIYGGKGTSVGADSITDIAGTGAPTFDNGLEVSNAADQDILNYYRDETASGVSGTDCTIEWRCIRIGLLVTCTVQFSSISSGVSTASGAGVIPSWARPNDTSVGVLYKRSNDNYLNFAIATNGDVFLQSYQPSTGSTVNFGAIGTQQSSLSYIQL